VNFWQNTGATIIGIRRGSRIILSPGPYAEFLKDDVFIMVGDEGSYERTTRFINE
jgi:K+/H+ antiporter YhaU regulatory subunit KhtT